MPLPRCPLRWRRQRHLNCRRRRWTARRRVAIGQPPRPITHRHLSPRPAAGHDTNSPKVRLANCRRCGRWQFCFSRRCRRCRLFEDMIRFYFDRGPLGGLRRDRVIFTVGVADESTGTERIKARP
jgi:hypothetical protein